MNEQANKQGFQLNKLEHKLHKNTEVNHSTNKTNKTRKKQHQ